MSRERLALSWGPNNRLGGFTFDSAKLAQQRKGGRLAARSKAVKRLVTRLRLR